MRIKDYPKATAPASDDYVIVDGGGGTRAIAATALKGTGSAIGPNSIYDMIEAGGKNTLGLRAITIKHNTFATFDSTVKTAIANGTYKNIYPGTKIGAWTVLGIRMPITPANPATIATENILVGQIKPMAGDSSGGVTSVESQSWYGQAVSDATSFFGRQHVIAYTKHALVSNSGYVTGNHVVDSIFIEWLGGQRTYQDRTYVGANIYTLPILHAGYRIKDVFGADANNVKTLISYTSQKRHVYYVETGDMVIDINNTLRNHHTIVTAIVRGNT